MYVAPMQSTRAVRLHHNAVAQERLEAMAKEIRNERRSTEQKTTSPPTTTERPVLAMELVSAPASIPCTPNAGADSTSQRIRAFLERASSPRLAIPQPGHVRALAEERAAEAREVRWVDGQRWPPAVPPGLMHEEQQQMLREQQQMMEMMRTAAAKAEDEESTAEAAPPHLRPTETQKKETPLPPSQMPRIAPAAYARQANNGSIKSGYVPSMAGIGVTFREVDGLWQVSAIKPGVHEVRRTSSCVRAGALSA